jgi:CubicO group peptidase (beta-lactamase class C family)
MTARFTRGLLGRFTAGVPSFSFHAVRYGRMSTGQLLDQFRAKPLDFTPGSRWRYSNSGYDLLGAVIGKVSHLSYAAFVGQCIFKPLGMRRSHSAWSPRAN